MTLLTASPTDSSVFDKPPKGRLEFLHHHQKALGIKPAQRIQKRRQAIAQLKAQMESPQFPQSVLSNVGVFSLSEDPLNILMWSHYAHYHQGFVVEFRIPTRWFRHYAHRIDRLLVSLPVTYSDQRPSFKYWPDDNLDAITTLLLTKSDIWSYEKEHRVVKTSGGDGVYKYARDEVLSGVIAGAKMSDDNRQVLADIVSTIKPEIENDLALYHAKQSTTEYSIEVPDHPRISPEKQEKLFPA